MANRTNKFGKTGLILSIITLVIGWIPWISWNIGILLWILAMTFSCIGLAKAPRGKAIAGIIICLIDVVVIVLAITIISAAILGCSLFQYIGS